MHAFKIKPKAWSPEPYAAINFKTHRIVAAFATKCNLLSGHERLTFLCSTRLASGAHAPSDEYRFSEIPATARLPTAILYSRHR
jgi:hypothetical protein